jgi:hypothetical protein
MIDAGSRRPTTFAENFASYSLFGSDQAGSDRGRASLVFYHAPAVATSLNSVGINSRKRVLPSGSDHTQIERRYAKRASDGCPRRKSCHVIPRYLFCASGST